MKAIMYLEDVKADNSPFSVLINYDESKLHRCVSSDFRATRKRGGVRGWSVVYYSNRCSLLLNAFKCIFAHYNAFECIFSAFCVCCILGFVAFSCILDPLCLHSLLLHSSISRCVHFDAFSDLLHFGYDAF